MQIAGLTLVVAACAVGAPAFAGPPYLTDDAEPTPHKTYEIYAFTEGAWVKGARGGSFGLDFNYGGAKNLQLTATFPIEFASTKGVGSTSGLGNIELAAKYKFLHQDSFGWDVAVFPRLFLPAGSHLGDDHASFLLPIWVGRDLGGDWSTFGGGGCALNHGGDSKNYCLAGWALTRQVTDHLQLGGELFHQSADAKGELASTILGLGATYDINDNLHILGYAGAGLENAAETGRGTAYTSFLFTF
jgi:hypothetical protein